MEDCTIIWCLKKYHPAILEGGMHYSLETGIFVVTPDAVYILCKRMCE